MTNVFYENLTESALVNQFFSETSLKFTSIGDNKYLELNQPTENESLKLRDFLLHISENIPVTIDRIAEKTSISKGRLEVILPIVGTQKDFYGIYRALEGVFIKKLLPREMDDYDNQKFSCNICKQEDYSRNDELVWCPHCKNSFHSTHIHEWIKVEQTCPVCRNSLREKDLISQK